MKKAIILGCSHAAGSEMSQDYAYGCLNSYPALIAQQLGYQVYNHAIPGGSNDAMFRIGCRLLPTLSSHDIIIACWIGPHRTEIYHEDNQEWLPISPGNLFGRTVPDEIMREGRQVSFCSLPEYEDYRNKWCVYGNSVEASHLNKIKNTYALNAMAYGMSVKVINLESFGSVDLPLCPPWINRPVDITFCDWAEQQNYSRTKYRHYFIEAHKGFAELVVSNLVL